MNTKTIDKKSLEIAVRRMMDGMQRWNEDAVIYQCGDGSFSCDPRSTYESVAHEHEVVEIYTCHDLDDVFPGFGERPDDAGLLVNTIAASMAASVLGSIKSDRKAFASRENGKLGGRPKKTDA